MTPVSGITNRVSSTASHRVRVAEPSAGTPEPMTGRAVIALAPVARSESAPQALRRPRADFLAHLIATAERLPQTREKRRAEPEVAIQAYVKVQNAARATVSSTLERVA
jgi:hypothetical protein